MRGPVLAGRKGYNLAVQKPVFQCAEGENALILEFPAFVCKKSLNGTDAKDCFSRKSVVI